jgi:exopolysaccharide biosynthesis polyprenyl glycosylphosphotransferase
MRQPKKRRKREGFMPWLRLLMDAATVYAVLYSIFWLRFRSGYFDTLLSPQDYGTYYKAFHLIVLITLFFVRFYGLYRTTTVLSFPEETWKVTKAVFAATLSLTAITFFLRNFSFSRTFLVFAGLGMAPAIAMQRLIFGWALMLIDNRRKSLRNVLVLGSDENVANLIRYYKKHKRFATRVAMILDSTSIIGSEIEGVPVMGRFSDLPELLKKEHMIHEVIVSDPSLTGEDLLSLLYACEKEMVTFRLIADVFGMMTSKMSVSYYGRVPVLSFTESPLSEWENRVLKRAVDIVLSGLGLILLAPLFALIAYLVKKDSKGPVFFRQERIGQDGHQFELYKFRTMREDAEHTTGPIWAKQNDERRTRLGAFLRENNLDELPQLWNVLKGDMSLVGPRPHQKREVEQYAEYHRRLLTIKPGITGMAQVSGRSDLAFEDEYRYDVFYIENWSLFLDINICFKTFFALIKRRKNSA